MRFMRLKKGLIPSLSRIVFLPYLSSSASMPGISIDRDALTFRWPVGCSIIGIGTTVAGVVGTDTDVEVSRGRAAFEVPLGVEKVCTVGVGSALGDSDDAGRGMEGAEGKVSSFERIEFARADVSLDEGIIAMLQEGQPEVAILSGPTFFR